MKKNMFNHEVHEGHEVREKKIFKLCVLSELCGEKVLTFERKNA